MSNQIGPRIIGKIELPEKYTHTQGCDTVKCASCGESTGTMYKRPNGMFMHDDCLEAENAQYWENTSNMHQRHQFSLNGDIAAFFNDQMSEDDYFHEGHSW